MYNFKRDAKVYFYVNGILYPVDVYPDVSISQTFNEDSHNRKTLHRQLDLHKAASITEANPANFSFTVPIKVSETIEPNMSIFEADYASGTIEPIDIFVTFTNKKFKLNKAVVESMVYNISMSELLTISVSGTASKLEEVLTLPAVPAVANLDPYVMVRGVKAEINSTVIPSVAAVSIETNNSITWTDNSTLHKSLASQVSYRDNYVLTERRLSGSITEFLLDEAAPTSEYSSAASIAISVYSEVGQSLPLMTFQLPVAVYTRRLSLDDLLTRVYDFRLTDNTVSIIPTLRS